jgi:A/G-specific adenine glycosylase
MEISDETIVKFQRKVFTFYKNHKRRLPWRMTNDPYKILVSELMLQQTQVSRVVPYYTSWVHQWPTIHLLATASRFDILQAWMGLGYNTRAIRLQKAAQIIVKEFQGDVIQAMNHYEAVPGVGRYTSQAVRIFATNADLITVDTNIRRIFIHEFNLPETVLEKTIWELAQRCLPKGRSRDWHNALMDYGALHLTAQKTGIPPQTKQTQFEGSDRQLRARIIRILLTSDKTFTALKKTLHVEDSRLQRILDKLLREEIIIQKNKHFYLKE